MAGSRDRSSGRPFGWPLLVTFRKSFARRQPWSSPLGASIRACETEPVLFRIGRQISARRELWPDLPAGATGTASSSSSPGWCAVLGRRRRAGGRQLLLQLVQPARHRVVAGSRAAQFGPAPAVGRLGHHRLAHARTARSTTRRSRRASRRCSSKSRLRRRWPPCAAPTIRPAPPRSARTARPPTPRWSSPGWPPSLPKQDVRHVDRPRRRGAYARPAGRGRRPGHRERAAGFALEQRGHRPHRRRGHHPDRFRFALRHAAAAHHGRGRARA